MSDGTEAQPLTYDAAARLYEGGRITAAEKRYYALTGRALSEHSAWMLRHRGEFDPDNPGHQLLAEAEPLSVADRLELMATGEVLARYYRHPSMLDRTVNAGASWEQIGAARGTSADQARQDYREWAEGQHRLWQATCQWGLDDIAYTEGMARADQIGPLQPGEAAAYAATLDELTQICPVPLPGEEHADTGRKAEAGQ